MARMIAAGTAAAFIAVSSTFAAAAAPPALLLHGGTIYTGNPAQPTAEAVLVVGSEEQLTAVD